MEQKIRDLKEKGIKKSDIYSSINRLFKVEIDSLIEMAENGNNIDFNQQKSILLFRKMQQIELIETIYKE